ncbi:nucleotidyltransferase [bacterium]|nr:MAG: nucleotidyltransferase [bacterium]
MKRQADNQNSDIGNLRRAIRGKLPELRQRYGVKSLGIFGSRVHGRQTRRSDIDLLVEFDDGAPLTLIGFVALERELSDLLRCRVDLVERETLKPAIGKRILEEVVPV